MAEGFVGGLHRHLMLWSGWVFTVLGAAAGLWIAREYAWVAVLLALTGLAALTAFAFEKHNDLQKAKKEHQARTGEFESDIRVAQERADSAERKLNEIPSEILLQLDEAIQRHSFGNLATELAKHADFVGRMVQMAQQVNRPITVRTFAKRAGTLFAEGRLNPVAISCLRPDDPFFLEKNSAGLVTRSAILRVHQLNVSKELVWFRVVSYTGEEMSNLDALAEKQEVPGKNYTTRPVCDVTRYGNWDLASLAAIIRTLTDEISHFRE